MAQYQRVNVPRGSGRVLIGVITDSKPIKKSGNVWRQGWESQAVAVHPDQAKRFTEAAHKVGNTDVEYCSKTGRLKATSRKGRMMEYARRGFYDRDAGYGETAGLSITGV